MTRTMLWLGAGITLAFVFIVLFAPLIAPYDFDTFRADGERFRSSQRRPVDHLLGHERAVDRRSLENHLGDPDRAQGRARLALLLDRDRRPTRDCFRLLRREARPRPRALDGRALRPSRSSCSRSSSPSCLRTRSDRGSSPPRSRSPSSTSPSTSASSGTTRSASGRSRSSRPRARSERGPSRSSASTSSSTSSRTSRRSPRQRGRRDPHARRARVPRLRNPADRRGGVGLRRQPGRLGRGVRDLVDRSVPRPRDRPAGVRPHPSRRGPQRDDQPRAPKRAKVDVDLGASARSRAAMTASRSSRCATCASTTGPCAAPCERSTEFARHRRGEVLGWSGVGLRQVDARRGILGLLPRVRPRTARSSTAAGTSSACPRRSCADFAGRTSG